MEKMRLPLALMLITLISGCATMTSSQQPLSPEQYYSQARKAQASGDYNGAIENTDALETNYPNSPYAQLAPLELAYARYKLGEYEAGILQADRFIENHPQHANLDYAYYLKGLIRSAQGVSSPAGKPGQEQIVDTDHVREAFKNFSTLVQRFPDSSYRDNALKRMEELRDMLARQELAKVKEQLANGDNEAAVKHAKYIAEQYPKTPAANEALELVTRAASAPPPETTESEIEFMPVTKPVAPAPAVSGGAVRHERWLLQQEPSHYTLQLFGTSSEQKLKRYIEQHKLQAHSAYFRRTHKDKDWYSLLYGNYSSRDEAAAEAKRLKGELKLGNIWIRSFKDVQASIVEGQDQ